MDHYAVDETANLTIVRPKILANVNVLNGVNISNESINGFLCYREWLLAESVSRITLESDYFSCCSLNTCSS